MSEINGQREKGGGGGGGGGLLEKRQKYRQIVMGD